jgi:hypothetical protein
MKQGKNLFLTIFFGVFLSIGLIFGAVSGVVFFKHQQFMETASSTTATIIDITHNRDFDNNKEGRVYVKYTVDYKDYVRTINYYTSSMQIGDDIIIYYQPDAPENITYKTNIIVAVFAILGTIFSMIGIIGYFIQFLINKGKNRLLTHGHRIYAEISEIIQDSNYTINNRHPYRILCKYEDGYGEVHIFKSEMILYNPTGLLKDNMVPVYVKENNYKKYYVKIDEVLPKKVNAYN